MEQKVFDVETFNRLLVYLKLQANAHQPKNEAALRKHNEVYFKSRNQIQEADEPFYVDEPEPVNLFPDVALVSDPEKVGKSIVEFISTILGVVTEGMLAKVSRPESIALSDRAVSALLRRENRGEVGMSFTFAYKGWPKHKLEFERIDPNHDRVAVSLEIGRESVPTGGEIEIGTITDGQFVNTRQSIQFDPNGVVLKASSEYKGLVGEKLNIIKMIEQVTTPENLGEPIKADQMVERTRQLKITENS